MPRMHHIAPAGTPINASELGGWLLDGMQRIDNTTPLGTAIKKRFNIRHCHFLSSGRAAMALIFSVLKDQRNDPDRDEVIIPSYTCYSVPASVSLAGLRVRICDIDPETLTYMPELLDSIDFTRVLAIVTANLYGYPNALPDIRQLAKKHGVFLVDDAAQSLDAKIDKTFAGTFGDIGLYSFDKGKNITSLQGGVITTNSDVLSEEIASRINELPRPGLTTNLSEGLKLVIYSLLLHPWLYWIPANIKWLGLGQTIYTTDYQHTQYSNFMAGMSRRLFQRIDQLTKCRAHNAITWENTLSGQNGIGFIHTLPGAAPVFLRFPVIIRDSKKIPSLINALNRNGIGATISYPDSIADLDEIKSFSSIHNDKSDGGRYIARHLITLPTHPFLTDQDIKLAADIFKEQLEKQQP